MKRQRGHHIIKLDNTKANRILICWMRDTCVKYNIPFKIKMDNGKSPDREMIFSYQNSEIFPISKNVNKIRKRLAEKECEEM